MPKDSPTCGYAPPIELVAQVKAGEVTDYNALMAWWMAPSTPGWLRSMPADLAVVIAAAGVPDPARWRAARASITDV